MNDNHYGAPDDMSTVDVAAFLDRHPGTVAVWRSNRTGPPYTRIRRRIVYRRADVEQWAAEHGIPTVATEGAA